MRAESSSEVVALCAEKRLREALDPGNRDLWTLDGTCCVGWRVEAPRGVPDP